MEVAKDLQPDHVNSHHRLLTVVAPETCGLAPVDAIIVPIAREVDRLRVAVELAGKLNCTVVAICSRMATAEAATKQIEHDGVDFHAVDLDNWSVARRPRFATTGMLAGTPLEYPRDTSVKRNLGLLLSNAMGWRRVVFLDDDITIPEPDDLRRATFLLDRFSVVGLHVDWFPDNSVVCHAHRDTDGDQDTFIGTGAMALNPRATASFFPQVYNEDWFFLLDAGGFRPVAAVGAAKQRWYHPYADFGRAQVEEFGDTLAEGIFELVENSGTDVGTDLVADADHWQRVLDRRRAFIEEIMARPSAGRLPAVDQVRMRSALRAALDMHEHIEAGLCVAYLAAWRRDQDVWARHLETFRWRRKTTVAEILAEWGLTG